MSKLTKLNQVIKEFKSNLDNKIKSFRKQIKEANEELLENDDGSFKIQHIDPAKHIKTLDKKVKDGVTAIIGFREDGVSELQAYVFEGGVYTKEDAKEWVKENDEKLKEALFNDDEGEGMRKDGKKVSFSDDLKENGVKILEKSRDLDEFDIDFIALGEATFSEDLAEVEAILISKGTNHNKKRHYPASTLQEAAPHFAGLKMYINHPTKRQEMEMPERNLKDWASTITESHFEDGKVLGKITVHDPWLRERLKDPVARKHIGLSINTGGKVSMGTVEGKSGYQIVEKIMFQRKNGPASVDWVTEPGARGRVSKLLKENDYNGGHKMELNEAKYEDLKRENPDLITQITESVKKSITESSEQKEKDIKIKENDEKIARFELKEKIDAQKVVIETKLKENKNLPDIAKARIVKDFSEKVLEEKELTEALTARIKDELEYINKFSTKGKINFQTDDKGKGSSLKESMTKELEDRMGIKEEKKKDDDDK